MKYDIGNAMLVYGAVGLSPAEERLFHAAMEALPGLLRTVVSEASLSVRAAPDDLLDAVLKVLARDKLLEHKNCALADFLTETLGRAPRVLLACPDDHELAVAAMRNNPAAVWGGCLKPLGLTYCPDNKYVMWHEALHLFGATDCYALPDRGPTCEQPNCIMQYEPHASTVGEWPCLCNGNRKLVRDWLARCDAATGGGAQ